MPNPMSVPTFFLRACPTCGRRLEVAVQHLGRDVECPSCGSRFATSIIPSEEFEDREVERVLRDAERYLATVDEWNQVAEAWSDRQSASAPP
ncbi:MAG TPA: hypothetical protein DCQ98_20230 [Planctomycetaceae bacterium]|nr:hypothetical protein [Planctomycetaceae bacterium]